MSSNTNLKYTGTIVFIGQTEVISDKFSKRQIVLSDKSSEYPQEICFEFNQSKCDDLDSHVVGGLVTISYNLKGKLWKDNKWFNVLNGWKIEAVNNLNPDTF
jgi:hypothetical protein